MPAYKSKARHIRDAVIALLQALTYDTGGGAESAFALVTGDPSQEFGEEPYALVYPAQITDTKGATGQADRAVGFAIFIMLSTENKQRTQNATYNYMYDLEEIVLDALDSADFHDSLNATDNTIGTWLMDIQTGGLVPADTKSGGVLLCTINLIVSYSKNL